MEKIVQGIGPNFEQLDNPLIRSYMYMSTMPKSCEKPYTHGTCNIASPSHIICPN